MRSVIMLAYGFPPEGSAGVYRPLRFVRHLTRMGWDTRVVSAVPYRYERYDPALLDMIPHETEIMRVKERDPWQVFQAWRGQRVQARMAGASVEEAEQIQSSFRAPLRFRLREAVRRAEAWYYCPDLAMSWIRPAVKATIQWSHCKRPNVIWATAHPLSSWVVAHQTWLRTGVPYVLDLRDPWGLNYYKLEVKRPAWAKRRYQRAMYRILKGAQAVVFLFDTVAECYWRAYPGALDASKVHIIPNGYDGAIEPFAAPEGGKCRILYVGTLSTYRYDMLLEALDRLKKSDPMQAKHLHLLFVGEGMEGLVKEAAARGLDDIVKAMGPTSHANVTQMQREAHALLVFGRKPEQKDHALLAGAKVFAYLQTGRPIVGVVPSDETRKVLHDVGVSTVADAASPSEIVSVLQQVLEAWAKRNLPSLTPNRTACEAYSAERQTAALVRALDGESAAVPFVPGSVDLPLNLRGD